MSINNTKEKKNMYYAKDAPTPNTIYKLPILPIEKLLKGMHNRIEEENQILSAYNRQNNKTISPINSKRKLPN